MKYVSARIEEESDRNKRTHNLLVYQLYVAEGLKAITENTSRMAGGVILNHSLLDILNGNMVTDSRTKEDIIDSISGKLEEMGRRGDHGRI